MLMIEELAQMSQIIGGDIVINSQSTFTTLQVIPVHPPCYQGLSIKHRSLAQAGDRRGRGEALRLSGTPAWVYILPQKNFGSILAQNVIIFQTMPGYWLKS